MPVSDLTLQAPASLDSVRDENLTRSDWRRERPFRVPISTYRVQLQPSFGFREAASIAPYLQALGVTDCYSSPFFKAGRGSTHGYDISDHNALNPELGSAEDFDAFVEQLIDCGLGQVLDFVPNHMGNDPRTNPWWRDVLENGPSSPFASFFDIDWEPLKPELRNKVLLPILSCQYGEALERGSIALSFRDGELVVNYQDRELPTNARETASVLRHDLASLTLGRQDAADIDEYLSVITQLQNLPAYTDRRGEQADERRRETLIARQRLMRLAASSSRIQRHIDQSIRAFNGRPGEPESFDLLHDFLERQPYRLAYWRTSAHEINYRRFFDVDDLAGLRMEVPEVFDATHRLLGELIATGKVTGVRIDHPDGLFGPAAYFARLQQLASASTGAASLYVVIEKILTSSQQLPLEWRVHGTTGYNFLNTVNGLFVCGDHAKPFRELSARITGRREPFSEVMYSSKKLIMGTALASELNVLAHDFDRIAEQHRRSRDFTLNSLRQALVEFIACLPVYRTYIDENGSSVADREVIVTAVDHARRRNPALESSIFDFLLDVLLPRRQDEQSPGRNDAGAHAERRTGYPPASGHEYSERIRFAMRLQQYTGPVHAKGVEDTAFYRYNVLVSLNEVGGSPGRFGVTPAEFHHENQQRLEHWPLELISTGTHDSKLGEDVRARINVLSELPDEWRRAVGQWLRINAPHRTQLSGEWAPDRNDEYRFYQVLIGVWPPDAGTNGHSPVPSALIERLRSYMLKAAKEAKIHTSWINDNERYDAALRNFVDGVLAGPTAPRFLRSFVPLARKIAGIGVVNSLSQLVLKLASPGVPDLYQGSELWNLCLVDPDNRHVVDYEARFAALRDCESILDDGDGPTPAVDQNMQTSGAATSALATERAARIQQLLTSWHDGRIKLVVTAAGLRLRRKLKDLFLSGDYIPLDAEMTVHGGIVAFGRHNVSGTVIAIAPRLVSRLMANGNRFPVGSNIWRSSRIFLPPSWSNMRFRNVLTGETVRSESTDRGASIALADALASCPVALLEGV